MRYAESVVLAGLVMGLASLQVDRLPAVAQTVAQTMEQRKAEAERLLQQGIQQFQVRQFEAAIRSWQQALVTYRKIKDRSGEENVLGKLGNAYQTLGNYAASIDLFQQQLKLAREIKNRGSEAAALSNMGSTYYSLEKYSEASEVFQQALVIAREQRDRSFEVVALNNLGNAYLRAGQIQQAIEVFQKKLALDNEIGNRGGELTSLFSLGWAYNFQGQYQRAIEFFQKTLFIAKQIGDRDKEASSLYALGWAYDDLGQHQKSIELYQEAFRIAQKTNDRSRMAHILNGLGWVHNSLRKHQQAIEFFQQQLNIAEEIKDLRQKANAFNGLGWSFRALNQYQKSISFSQKALTIQQQIGDLREESYSWGDLGRAFAALGEKQKAIEFYQRALAIQSRMSNRWGEGITLSDIADLLTQQHQLELAIVFYKQSVNVREAIRKDIQGLPREQQESFTQTVSGTYRALANLLLAQGRVLEAQQVLELLKIQELRDYTRDTRTGGETKGSPLNPLEQPIPAAYNDKITLGYQLTQCEQQKCAQRAQLIAQRDAANQKFTSLVDRLKKLLREQEIKDPAQLQNDRFTLAAQKVILANPNTKTVLVYPLVLDDKLWLVWGSQAGKSGIVFDSKEIPIKRKDLSAKVGELQTLLSQRGDLKQLQQVSQQLYQLLIAPIRPQLDKNGVQHIVFSLDRATRYIPMAALHDGKHYLIENFAVSTILTAEIDTQDKLSPRADDPVLGLGLTQEVPGFAALPAVKTEIDGIVRITDRQDANGIYPGLELLDRDFTETALRENVSDYRILHIATHGKFVSGNPEDSFLVLGNGSKLNIPTIRSITALANTHLVVLSACETGKGGVDKEGLEVAGIGHYFLLSGAKSIMASLWLVNDPATSLLMQRFYQTLSRGNHSKAEALRQVQRAYINGKLTAKDASDRGASALPNRAGGRRYVDGQPPVDSLAHPYYWAPFILIGNTL